jgi:hypothetical protein
MNLRENLRRSKEVIGAYLRQGAHELGSVFYGPGTAAQHPEYGMAWTRTPGEIADGMRGKSVADSSRSEPGSSVLASHLQAMEKDERPREQERERPEPEIERE